MLSICIVNDDDLADPEVIAFWRRAIRSRLVLAILAGAPCETWSVAWYANEEGLPPLRSADALQGLLKLTARQMQQSMLANTLMFLTLVLMVEALIHGASVIIEHPAKTALHSVWHQLGFPPSVWRYV